MKDDNKTTVMDELTEWWDYLETSEKVAAVWLAMVVVIIVTLGFLFPIFGIIAFCIAALIGTMWAIVHLLS